MSAFAKSSVMAKQRNNPKWAEAAKLLAEGMTATAVCDALGVNRNSISRWRKNPVFLDLCKAALAGKKRELRGLSPQKTDAPAMAEDEFTTIAKAAEIVNVTLRPSQRKIVEAFDAGAKIAIFGGGNGAGKTFLALREALETCWGLKEWAPELSTVKIIGLDWPQLAKVFAPYITKYVPEELVVSWGERKNSLPTHIKFKNGSELTFGTNKQGWAAHQGQRCNLIIYDEEPDYPVFEEGLARGTREGKAPRILFTMTPTKGKGWVWEELVLDRERRRVVYETCAIFENGEGTCVACDTTRTEWDAVLRQLRLERDPAEFPIHGGRWLNLQLEAMEHTTFSRDEGYCHRCWTFGVQPFYEEDYIRNQVIFNPNRKRVAMRLLGSWENLDGSALFDADKLAALEAYVTHAKTDDGFSLQTWEEPRPRYPYVIGVDPARGTGRDETVFQVVNAVTGVQAACWADNDKRLMSQFHELKSLCRRYGRAFTLIEYSSAGEGLLPMADEEGSIPLWHKATKTKDGDIRLAVDPGLPPTPRARSRALTKMISAIDRGLVKDKYTGRYHVTPGRADALYINDPETLRQLARMFYDEDDKIVSPKGGSSHDDRVLALAFAWEALRHPHVRRVAPKSKNINVNSEMRRYHQRRSNTYQNKRNPWARR